MSLCVFTRNNIAKPSCVAFGVSVACITSPKTHTKLWTLSLYSSIRLRSILTTTQSKCTPGPGNRLNWFTCYRGWWMDNDASISIHKPRCMCERHFGSDMLNVLRWWIINVTETFVAFLFVFSILYPNQPCAVSISGPSVFLMVRYDRGWLGSGQSCNCPFLLSIASLAVKMDDIDWDL